MGFVDEWLRLAPGEAAKYASPNALAARAGANALFEKNYFSFDVIRDCGNSTWEVALSPPMDYKEASPHFYVLVSGTTASKLRVVRADRQPQTGCVAASRDMLSAPLPQ